MTTLDQIGIVKLDSCWTRIGVWGSQTPRCEKLDKVIHCRNCTVYTNAGRGLLERAPPPDYVDEWTGMLTRSNQATSKTTKSLLVFRIRDELIAISTRLVKEIVEMGRMHKIPHKDKNVIKGLVNIRGELKICVSVGSLLGIRRYEEAYENQQQVVYSERLIVVAKDGGDFVFPVSEVMGIRRVDPHTMQEAPSTISNSMLPYISGIYRIDNKSIGMIDEDNLFNGLGNILT